MTISKISFCLIFGCLIAGSVNAQSRLQPVTPRQSFPSNTLNVHSPDAEGWVITGTASYGISFAKRGTESGETYGAQAVVFEMPKTNGSEELVGFVKKRIATMNPPPRYQETDAIYQYTEDRGHPCVNVQIAFDDTAAVTPTGTEQLKLQVIALYCRHPTLQQVGFFAAYSHRGKSTDDQLASAAKSFIEGVDVPKK